MERVRVLYHVTSLACKSSILTAKKLLPQIHNPKSKWMWLLNSKYKDMIPKGIWFCSTLYRGDLPTISPYGKERVRIPIEMVLGQLGGKINIYLGEEANVGENRYIRIMLVKEGDTFPCLKYMKKLDFNDNSWLKCISGSDFQVAQLPFWVEIYVPYEIDITKADWDTI